MKRFYERVSVAGRAGGYAIELDGRPVRTPLRRALVVPSRPLANEIAAEWVAQGKAVLPRTMPLTRLAATAIDVVGSRRAEVGADVARYAGTDLVCYWAETPPDLVARQSAAWQPLLDWVGERYDVRLATTRGVVPIAQPKQVLLALRRAVEAENDWRLTGLAGIVGATGSVVIGLALAEGLLDADAAFAASQVDETYEIEQWGEDAEATARRVERRATIANTARFLSLL